MAREWLSSYGTVAAMSFDMIYPTIEDAIGKTPLVALQRIGAADNAQRGNILLGKLEGNNPAGSVKDRPALSMIQRAQERGDIKAGDADVDAQGQLESSVLAAIALYEATGKAEYRAHVEANYARVRPYNIWWWGPYLSRPGRFFGRFLNKSGDLARQDLRASRGV